MQWLTIQAAASLPSSHIPLAGLVLRCNFGPSWTVDGAGGGRLYYQSGGAETIWHGRQLLGPHQAIPLLALRRAERACRDNPPLRVDGFSVAWPLPKKGRWLSAAALRRRRRVFLGATCLPGWASWLGWHSDGMEGRWEAQGPLCRSRLIICLLTCVPTGVSLYHVPRSQRRTRPRFGCPTPLAGHRLGIRHAGAVCHGWLWLNKWQRQALSKTRDYPQIHVCMRLDPKLPGHSAQAVACSVHTACAGAVQTRARRAENPRFLLTMLVEMPLRRQGSDWQPETYTGSGCRCPSPSCLHTLRAHLQASKLSTKDWVQGPRA